MHYKTVLTFAFAISLSTVSAQAPVIQWQRTFGGSENDIATCVASTPDGGSIVAGQPSSVDGDITSYLGSGDFWIVKLDATGAREWQKTYGGSSDEEPTAIAVATDGGYIVAGYTRSTNGDITNNHGDYDCWVVKLDASGALQWQKTLGGSGSDGAKGVALTPDGGYIVSGWTISTDGDVTNNHGASDFWVLKLDANGTLQWQKTLGGSGSEGAIGVALATDGGYLVGGSTSSQDFDVTNNHGSGDYWVVKLDASGDLLWQRTLGGSSSEVASSISATTDGGCIIAGTTQSVDGDVTNNQGGADYWVVKLDTFGSMEWQRTFGGIITDYAQSVASTPDGGGIVAGVSRSQNGNTLDQIGSNDFWVVKFDIEGNLQWQKALGGSGPDVAYAIANTDDGGYLCVGITYSTDGDVTSHNGLADYWVVKLSPNFNTISGIAFADLDNDGVQDTDEPGIAHHRVQLMDANLPAWSGADGAYSVNVFEPGIYGVEPDPMLHFLASPATHTSTFMGLLETDSLNDFAFQPVGVINDLSVSIAPLTPFRPGFTGRYLVHYQNVGSTALAPNVSFQFVDPFTYLSSSIEPTAITPDSVSWQLPELQPFEEGTIEVTVNISATAVLGSTVTATATILPLEGDANSADNSALWSVTITGSYDPNDIQVDRPKISPEELADGMDLTYLIRFQNSGTDTAFTVRVDNPVPVNADFNTFDFIAASHPVQISYTAATSKLSFLFNNILLPDSNTNEPESHGYILYRMQPRSTLVLGDSVLNQVGIYFDYNLPIITNVAHTVIEQSTGIPVAAAGNALTLFPNPTVGEVMLRMPGPVSNGAVTVSDAMGRTVLQTMMNGITHFLDLGAVPRGFYVVSVQDAEGVHLQQVVLE